MQMHLIAAALAFTAGIAQVLLSSVLFRAVFTEKVKKMLAALFGKIAVYGGFFYLLFTVLRPGITGAAVGFAAGFFPGLLVWYLVRGRRLLKGGNADNDHAADR